MYPQQVYQVDYRQPPPFYTCQRWTIVILNAIFATLVLIYMVILLLATLVVPSLEGLFILLFLLLVFGYFYCAIYGAYKENECVFRVYLIVNIITTVLAVCGTVITLGMILHDSGSNSGNSRKIPKGRYYFEEDENGELEVKVFTVQMLYRAIFSMVLNIAWTVFLVFFARNLRRWNQQKVGGGGGWSGRV